MDKHLQVQYLRNVRIIKYTYSRTKFNGKKYPMITWTIFYNLGHYFIGKLYPEHIKISKYCPYIYYQKISSGHNFMGDIIKSYTYTYRQEFPGIDHQTVMLHTMKGCVKHWKEFQIRIKMLLYGSEATSIYPTLIGTQWL